MKTWNSMMMISDKKPFDLSIYLHRIRPVIDQYMERLFNKNTLPGRLSDAMRYAVTAGGKRLRPILCIAAGESVGGEMNERLLTAGCALEFIHTYSLIHDDLPAMDDDALRRGNPTCHVAYDEATAILSGDALLTLAFEILADYSNDSRNEPVDWLKVIGVISKAAGARGMLEGQMRDMLAEGRLISLDDLEALHRLKTGALITASVESGALIAGANETQLELLRQYAQYLGTAFQVTDDLLNVEGDPAVMGKAAGTDEEKMKSTYPSLIGVDASRKKARELIDNALHALEIFDTKADPLRAIAEYVLSRDK